jgi:uncharacterized Zn ribbon protein
MDRKFNMADKVRVITDIPIPGGRFIPAGTIGKVVRMTDIDQGLVGVSLDGFGFTFGISVENLELVPPLTHKFGFGDKVRLTSPITLPGGTVLPIGYQGTVVNTAADMPGRIEVSLFGVRYLVDATEIEPDTPPGAGMRKFKIGDRVQMKFSQSFLEIGTICRIVKLYEDDTRIGVFPEDFAGRVIPFTVGRDAIKSLPDTPEQLSQVFREGDYVRVIRDFSSLVSGQVLAAGTVGTVKIANDMGYPVGVQPTGSENIWAVSPEFLVLTARPSQKPQQFEVIRIWTQSGEGGESRLYGSGNSATEIEFSVSLKRAEYDEAISRFCAVLPALLRADAELMEMYDGDLSSKPSPEDIQTIQQFRIWARKHDLQSYSDLLSPDSP